MADAPSGIGSKCPWHLAGRFAANRQGFMVPQSSVGPGSLALIRAPRPPASYADDRCVLLLPVQRLCCDTVCLANKERE